MTPDGLAQMALLLKSLNAEISPENAAKTWNKLLGISLASSTSGCPAL
jgi:hypothetical protein